MIGVLIFRFTYHYHVTRDHDYSEVNIDNFNFQLALFRRGNINDTCTIDKQNYKITENMLTGNGK